MPYNPTHQQVQDLLNPLVAAARNLLEELASEGVDKDAVAKKYVELCYRMGYKDAVGNYGVWKDGVQHIGVMSRPIKEVCKAVDESYVPITF